MPKSQRSSSTSRVNMSTRAKATKNNKVPVAVTPIATFREELESEEKVQTTMTQFAQKWNETTFSSSSDDEDSELSSDLLTPPTRRKKRSKMNRKPEEEKNEDEEDTVVDAEEIETAVPLKAFDAFAPQPGDLVMSTAEKVQHPAYNFNQVHGGFILLGVVIGVDEESEYQDYYDVHWASVEKGIEFIDVRSGIQTSRPNGVPAHYMVIPSVEKSMLTILSRKPNYKSIKKLNDFLTDEIKKKFVFYQTEGWAVRSNPLKK